jgi:hypothetical protein
VRADAHYVAECLWPSVTTLDVDALDRRLRLHARTAVTHIGTTLVPEDDVVFVWFDAASPIDVEAICHAASVPFDRIVAVRGSSSIEPRPPRERTRP